MCQVCSSDRMTACIRMCWWSEMIYEDPYWIKESSRNLRLYMLLEPGFLTQDCKGGGIWVSCESLWNLERLWKMLEDINLWELWDDFSIWIHFCLAYMRCIFDVFLVNIETPGAMQGRHQCGDRAGRWRWERPPMGKLGKWSDRFLPSVLSRFESFESFEFRQNSGQRQQLMSSGALKGVVSIVVIWGTLLTWIWNKVWHCAQSRMRILRLIRDSEVLKDSSTSLRWHDLCVDRVSFPISSAHVHCCQTKIHVQLAIPAKWNW